MELLGVGPGEILLILVIMLLVFGPERLPEFARQAGLFVVRVRDWIQRSPDAALVLRARAELESELQAIRAELTREVESVRQDLQSVRSDLADAGKLVEQSAQDAAAVSKIELPDTTAQSAGSAIDRAACTRSERSCICTARSGTCKHRPARVRC
jgi:sec-independent protein translocase protein TatB